MGNTDRWVRVIVALLLGALYLTGKIEGTLGVVALVVAVVFLLTSVVRFCPLYYPFGIRTCKTEKQ